MYHPYRILLPANISKLIPLSIKQTWVHYPNLGSPTSHGHNSLTVRSYVTFHIPPEMGHGFSKNEFAKKYRPNSIG
jgi:hypothetical protein